jgi:RNA polymerase sigma-70 factor, ECF subfamily
LEIVFKRPAARYDFGMDATRQSLLIRAQAGEETAWESLTALYRPLILGWLNRQGVPPREREDISQDVLLSVVKNLPGFQHSGQRGAFRCWLRTILSSRTADYWRANSAARLTPNGNTHLQEVADPASELNKQWDEEHDRYILQCLMDLVEEEFEPATLRAFRRLALDGASGAAVAKELGMSVAAVYVAKSRVLQRIRQEAEGLID